MMGAFKKMLHSVCAWSVANNVMLGQQAVDEKKNVEEITAIPQLLKTLQLKGSDHHDRCHGCQKDIAQQIHDGGGDYVLALKDNQPLIFEAVQKHFHDAHVEDSTTVAIRDMKVEKGHGRLEKRHYFQCPIPKELRPLFAQWRGARSIGKPLTLSSAMGKETSEVRYFISSLDVGVSRNSPPQCVVTRVHRKQVALDLGRDIQRRPEPHSARTMEPKILGTAQAGTCSALSSSDTSKNSMRRKKAKNGRLERRLSPKSATQT